MPHNNMNALSDRPEVLTRPKLEGGRRPANRDCGTGARGFGGRP